MKETVLIQDLEILDEVDAAQASKKTAGAPGARNVFIETYGCQMNVSDSEVVAAVLLENGYGIADSVDHADVILLNTCAIRENAEQKIRRRLAALRAKKRDHNPNLTIGVLGCMAERLRNKLLEQEKLVDIVVGPDAYRDMGKLIAEAEGGQAAVNVLLSREETYADIEPVRYATNGLLAFVTIMRGCDNMCSFCVVPFTRGRERSRPAASILNECQNLVDNGFREITVLGQNVNSYYIEENGEKITFAKLLYKISQISPELRIRYSTSHPKDCSDELLELHASQHNVCDYIHLPVQHGNTDMLKRMRRTYSREHYLDLVDRARKIAPNVSFSTDIIAGFCDETEAEHQDTLSLMEAVKYDMAYMFAYSERPDTYAARKMEDNIPEDVKKRRLSEIIRLQGKHSLASNQTEIGKTHIVLVEGTSKRSDEQLAGRTDTNKVVVFDKEDYQKGQYVKVEITACTSGTLIGKAICLTTLEAEAAVTA